MGLKHLKIVESFLKRNKKKSFLRTHLMKELGINYNILIEVLDYLVLEKKIVLTDSKYQWRTK